MRRNCSCVDFKNELQNRGGKHSWKGSVGNSTREEQSVAYYHGNMVESNDVACTAAEVEAQVEVALNMWSKAGEERLVEDHAYLSPSVSIVNDTDDGVAAQKVDMGPLIECSGLKNGMCERLVQSIEEMKRQRDGTEMGSVGLIRSISENDFRRPNTNLKVVLGEAQPGNENIGPIDNRAGRSTRNISSGVVEKSHMQVFGPTDNSSPVLGCGNQFLGSLSVTQKQTQVKQHYFPAAQGICNSTAQPAAIRNSQQ
ncbi:hypothetical protein ACSBR2_029356 [Camellia fascicularis]